MDWMLQWFLLVLVSVVSAGVTGVVINGVYRRKFYLAKSEADRKLNISAEAERIMYKSLLDHTSDGIVLMDENYTVCEVNRSFLQMFDYAENELLGNPLYKYILSAEYALDEMSDAIIRTDHDRYETVRTRKNGMPIVVQISTFMLDLPTQEGTRKFICSRYTDITEKKEAEKKIKELAYYDTLTSLPNRYLLESKVAELILMSKESSFSFIFMDFNGFKHINDTLGHEFGDALLVAFSKRVRGNIKQNDFLARMGGDEFVLLLPDTPREMACKVVERINTLLQNPFLINGQRIFIGLATGIAGYPEDSVSADELYRCADIAMYTAKQQKLSYVYYNEELKNQYRERLELEQDLIAALKHKNEIVLHYLPVIDLEKHKIISFEALCRWHHPKLGLIPSARFIPVAEDSQLIYKLGSVVLQMAFKQAYEWKASGFEFSVTVNLSAKEVLLAETVQQIDALRKKYKGIEDRIELEITEAVSIMNVERGKYVVAQLRSMGFKIILDDFGVGYSSLSFLRDLHVDRLKIDKRLIDDVQHTNSTSLILKGLLHLASIIDVDVVAEGVSTMEQKLILEEIGFTYLQGFLFSEPVPAEEVEHVMRQVAQSNHFFRSREESESKLHIARG